MPKIFSDDDRELLRNKMLEAGIKMLQNKGYKSISVEDIALEVGVAKGTFYNFFRSKEAFFYEIMQYIKELNREPLRSLPENADEKQIAECLFEKYMNTKTVYDYFTPEEMKQIVRRLPDGDSKNDSEAFAAELCHHLNVCKGKPEVIVAMCNIMGLAGANRNIMKPEGFEGAVRKYCRTIAEYIVKGE